MTSVGSRACASFVAISLVGCASILGGLDEGTSRETKPTSSVLSDASTVEDAAARFDSAECAGLAWLAGFRRRLPLRIEHPNGQAIRDYQVRIDLPLATLVSAGVMRSDQTDLRVTRADGVTVVPHWREGDIVWARWDLSGSGNDRGWLYYDNPMAAIDTSSLTATFVDGIVDNPQFERNESWSVFLDGEAEEPSGTNISSAVIADGRAVFRLSRKRAHENALFLGLCQPLVFPEEPGVEYRLIVDVNSTLTDDGSAVGYWITPQFVQHNWIWVPEAALGSHIRESFAVPRGGATACIGVSVNGFGAAGAVEASYANVRVRRFIEGDPKATVDGPEILSETMMDNRSE